MILKIKQAPCDIRIACAKCGGHLNEDYKAQTPDTIYIMPCENCAKKEISNLKKELARAMKGPNESKSEELRKLGVTSLSWNRSEFDKAYRAAKQRHKRREP